MENLLFIRIEIIVFIASFMYILYYILDKFFIIFLKIKKIISPSKKIISSKKIKRKGITYKKQLFFNKSKDINKLKKEKLDIEEKNIINENILYNEQNPNFIKKERLNNEEKQKIIEILKKVNVHIAKGYFDSARALIIEGLAIDKFNKDLNFCLASIYEKEKKYQNAEYIYKDLIKSLKNNFEIKKKLGFNLVMQVKFDEALPIYEEAHKQKKSDNIIVGMLTDLTYDMQKYQKCLNYVNLFLKENPRNVDKMFIKSECLEVLQQNNKKSMSEIINMYNKILELQPYNTKARDKLKGLLEK